VEKQGIYIKKKSQDLHQLFIIDSYYVIILDLGSTSSKNIILRRLPMKKFAGILLSALLLVPLSANAAVSTQTDKLGDTTYVRQINYSGPWDSVKLQYVKGKSLPTLTLTRTDSSYLNNPTYYLFSDKAQLVTDDVVSNLKLIKAYRNIADDLGTFEFTPAQIASIQNAKTVSLRVPAYNNNTIRWQVPEKVAKEWKEILTQGQSPFSLQNTQMATNHSVHHDS